MSEGKEVWIVDSEAVENRIRSELAQFPVRIVSFRNVCDAIEVLRNCRQKPDLILGNYAAADLMIEVAHQKSRYAGVRTAYVCKTDLSEIAKSHEAVYVMLGDDESIDGLANLVNNQPR